MGPRFEATSRPRTLDLSPSLCMSGYLCFCLAVEHRPRGQALKHGCVHVCLKLIPCENSVCRCHAINGLCFHNPSIIVIPSCLVQVGPPEGPWGPVLALAPFDYWSKTHHHLRRSLSRRNYSTRVMQALLHQQREKSTATCQDRCTKYEKSKTHASDPLRARIHTDLCVM